MGHSPSGRRLSAFLLALSLALWSVHAAAVLLDINDEDGYTQYLGVTGLSTGRNAPYRRS